MLSTTTMLVLSLALSAALTALGSHVPYPAPNESMTVAPSPMPGRQPALAQAIAAAQARAAHESAVQELEAALKEAERHTASGLPGAAAINIIRLRVNGWLDPRIPRSSALSADERAEYTRRFAAIIDLTLRPYVQAKRSDLSGMTMDLSGAVALARWQTSLDRDVGMFRQIRIEGIFALNQEGSLQKLSAMLSAGLPEFRELVANSPAAGRNGLTAQQVMEVLSAHALAPGLPEFGSYRLAYIQGRRATDDSPTSTTSVAGLVTDPRVRDHRYMRPFLTGDIASVVAGTTVGIADWWWFALGIHVAMTQRCAAQADSIVGEELASNLKRVIERQEQRKYLDAISIVLSGSPERAADNAGAAAGHIGANRADSPLFNEANGYMSAFIQSNGGCSGRLASAVYANTRAFALRERLKDPVTLPRSQTGLTGMAIIRGEWIFRRVGQPNSPALTLTFEPAGGDPNNLGIRVRINASGRFEGEGSFGSTPGNPGNGSFLIGGDRARLYLNASGVLRMVVDGEGNNLALGEYEGVRSK